MPEKQPRYTDDDTTGRFVAFGGVFSFTVENYDDSSYVVHNNRPAMPIFVREVCCKDYEDACDRAWKQARLNSK